MNKLTIAAVAIACGAVLASASVRAETSKGGPTQIGNKCFTHWAGEAKDGRFGSWGDCPAAASTASGATTHAAPAAHVRRPAATQSSR
jgi:hypothetical protein